MYGTERACQKCASFLLFNCRILLGLGQQRNLGQWIWVVNCLETASWLRTRTAACVEMQCTQLTIEYCPCLSGRAFVHFHVQEISLILFCLLAFFVPHPFVLFFIFHFIALFLFLYSSFPLVFVTLLLLIFIYLPSFINLLSFLPLLYIILFSFPLFFYILSFL